MHLLLCGDMCTDVLLHVTQEVLKTECITGARDFIIGCNVFKMVSSHQQINYAVVTSTEVAYFSYIYSVISVENYQRATGYLRSAMLVGYTFGASLGQVLVSLAGRAYRIIKQVFCMKNCKS